MGICLDRRQQPAYYGIAGRVWLWDHSGDSLRFPYDITNGWNRGMDVYRLAVDLNRRQHPDMPIPRRGIAKLTWPQWLNGFFADYDHTVALHEQGDYGLDYSPLRLLIMSGWVKYTLDLHPRITQWNDNITWPLMWLNTACEMIAAISAGLLTWLWARRSLSPLSFSPDTQSSSPSAFAQPFRQLPVLLGLIAYLLVWFNPTILLEAHAWPQWEVWLIAAYLLAALLLSLNWPVAAGMAIAIGCMMKGQMLQPRRC